MPWSSFCPFRRSPAARIPAAGATREGEPQFFLEVRLERRGEGMARLPRFLEFRQVGIIERLEEAVGRFAARRVILDDFTRSAPTSHSISGRYPALSSE